MARSVRVEYQGAFYHVMARGNCRLAIFKDEEDRRRFVQTLGEACGMTGWRLHAWVLLSNHYHLMIETPEANLVAGMQWLQNTLTRRFNVRHRAWGRVFGDRYKAVLVEGGERFYYETLMDYIHLNPVRARLVRVGKGESILDYRWSSLAMGYALPPRKRTPWLAARDGLDVFGFPDTAAGRRRMVERLERRALEEGNARAGVVAISGEVDARCSHLRRGWYWGRQSFAEKMLKLARKTVGRTESRAYRGLERGPSGGCEKGWRRRGWTRKNSRLLPGVIRGRSRWPGSYGAERRFRKVGWQNAWRCGARPTSVSNYDALERNQSKGMCLRL